jgi:hypothetical protein
MQKLLILSTEHVSAFYMVLAKNSDCFLNSINRLIFAADT